MSRGKENTIPSQNGKKVHTDIPLFTSKSIICPRIPAKWQKMNKKKIQKEYFESTKPYKKNLDWAWDEGERDSFSLFNDNNLLLIEYKEVYYVFNQDGSPVGILAGDGSLKVKFSPMR